MKKISLFFVGVVLGVSLCVAQAVTKEVPASQEAWFQNIPLFTDAITLIQKYYVREVSAKDLIYGALKGMVQTLDPYSEFLPPKKFEEMKNEAKGEFGGVGLVVSMKDHAVTVVSPMEGTPAHEAGINPGDVITDIDGISTKSMSFSESVDKMRGKPGSTVAITILRKGEDTLRTFTLKRKIIEIENVKDVMLLTDTIGYARIVDFGEKTKGMLTKAVRDLYSQGARSLILDVRNNPGGLLDAAVNVCELFLPKGALIVYTKDRSGKEQLRFESSGRQYMDFEPLVILINKGSASGSEIVAGALKDNKRGIIIGKTSFGKASVQTVVPLRDESALRLTTAEYYTPSGISIHGKGITPDIEVAYKNTLVDRLTEERKKNKESKTDEEDTIDEYLFDKSKRKDIVRADSQVERALAVIQGTYVWDSTAGEK